MGTTFTCPNGHTYQTGETYSGVTFADNRVNARQVCPVCKVPFDAAPEDGTYSTIRGRLTRVADYLGHADRRELERLVREVEDLRTQFDEARAEAVLARVGVEPTAWIPSDRQAKARYNLELLLLLHAVAAALLGMAKWGVPEAMELLHQVLRSRGAE